LHLKPLKVKSVKRWIAFGTGAKGKIVIDRGAENAVANKGKSILPVGIIKVEGKFSKGDILKVFSIDNKLIAKGISNFSDDEISMLMGKNEKRILAEFNSILYGEVIHRDSLVVFDEKNPEY